MILIGSFNKNFKLGNRLKAIESDYKISFRKSNFFDFYFFVEREEKFYYNDSEKISVIFQGEIYKNEINLCSAELVYRIYKKYGDNFENNIEGQWSIVILDERRKKITISTDIMGFGKVYYKYSPDLFFVVNKLKYLYLLSHYNFISKKINKNFIIDYIVYNTDPTNVYSSKFLINSRSLLPSHKMIVSKNGIKIVKHFEFKINDKIGTLNKKHLNDKKKEFKKLFLSSIENKIPSDKSYGLELSGGIDSSSILFAILDMINKKKVYNNNIEIVHISLDEEKRYLEFAEKELKKHKIIINKLKYSAPNFNNFLKLIFIYDNFLTSYNFISSKLIYDCFKTKNIDIVLDGDGPDEMLCGYEYKYIAIYLIDYLREFGKKHFLNEIEFYRNYISPFNSGFNFSSFENIINHLLSMIKDARKNRCLNKILLKKYIEYENPVFIKNSLSDTLLFDFYNISITSGTFLNYRRAYLNRDIIKLFFSIPISYKIYKGTTKYILKESMKKLVPSDIIKRKKFGGIMSPEFKTQFVINNKVNFLKIIKESLHITNYIDMHSLDTNFDYIADLDPNLLLRILVTELHIKAVYDKNFYKNFVWK